MIKILYVISDLDYSGAAQQLSLLATGLPRNRYEIKLCALGPGGPMGERLQNAEIALEMLDWRRPFDLRPFWRFRKLVSSFAPDIIHTWQVAALRMTRFAGRNAFRLVAGSALAPRRRHSLRDLLDLRILRGAGHVIAATPAEAERGRRLGLTSEQLVTIPPGLREVEPKQAPEMSLARALGLKTDDRVILCVGPLQAGKGYYEAIWAFDILHFLYDNLHLVLVGAGLERSGLEDFARQIQGARSVHFLGRQPEILPLLTQADVVWVPSRTRGGVNVALEALAAGRPVIASRVPDLADLFHDGVDGLLVPPGDKVALARATRLLLDDPVRGRKLGDSARVRVLKEFSADDMIERYSNLYERLMSRRQPT